MRMLITDLIILLLLTAGCSVETNNSNELPTWNEHNLVPDFLDLKLQLEISDEVERGNEVIFKLTMTNTGTEDLVIEGGDGPESFAFKHRMGYHDFIVIDSNNTLYWRYHHPPTVTVRDDRGHTLHLKKGESLSSTFVWNGKDINEQTLKPGKYIVTGLYEVTGVIENGKTIVGHPDIAEKGELKFPHYTTEPKEIIVK